MFWSFLNDWFSVSVRRNRISFVFSTITLIITFAICFFVWLLFAQTDRGKTIGLFVFGIPTAICSYLLVAQRLRDFGVSGWWSLLWIPVNSFQGEVRAALTLAALLVLCGIPGTHGANKYGEDPINR